MGALSYIRTIHDILINRSVFEDNPFKVYGFLLFNTQHKSLCKFLLDGNNQTLIDKVSGDNTLIFTALKPDKKVLKLIKGEITKKEATYRGYDPSVKVPGLSAPIHLYSSYDPNESFEIANKIGVPKINLPCIVLFRNLSPVLEQKKIETFASIHFKDTDFTEEAVSAQERYLTAVFDTIDALCADDSFDDMTENQVVTKIKENIQSQIFNKTYIEPMVDEVENGIKALAKLPFSFLRNFDKLLEEYARKKLIGKDSSPSEGS